MFRRWQPILRYARSYRRTIAGGAVALILGNLALTVAPYLMREGVSAIEEPLAAGTPIRVATVALWALLALLFAALGGLGAFLKRYLLMRVSRRMETDLRRDLFRHIQRLPLSYFDRTRTGDLMSRATADIEAARMAVGPASMYLGDSLTRFAFTLPVMIAVNPLLTAYALLPLAGICAGLVYFAPRIHRRSRVVQDLLAAISARAQESFAGSRVVKTFAMEEREQRTMDDLGSRYVRANLDLARVRGLTVAWIAAMGSAGWALLIHVGGRQYMAGTFDIGGLLLFSTYLSMLTWPMMAIGWVLSLVQRGAAGVDRLAEVFAAAPEADAGGAAPAIGGALSIRGLRFGYGDREVLSGIDVEIPAGATVGIVGPTGSGKSTLVSLLARLYDPPRGSVLLDGRDVLDLPLGALRAAIAFVPQEAFLFSATIRENIGFGRDGAEEQALVQAVADASLAADLAEFPDGLDTIVGERGITLSGGQKQRAALARALVADAPVLVLDDALSAVDAETETRILESLRRVRRGRTVLIVAHRVSAVRDSDLILHLDGGRVTERGTHAALVARGGAYARMARLQEIEAEIEAMAPEARRP